MISAPGIAMSTILRSTRKPLLCMLLIRPNMLSNFDSNGLKRIVRISSKISSIIPPLWFIASFAFVLQMLRVKPIPLKMHERIPRLPLHKGGFSLASFYNKSAEKTSYLLKFCACKFSVKSITPRFYVLFSQFISERSFLGVFPYIVLYCEMKYERLLKPQLYAISLIDRSLVKRGFLAFESLTETRYSLKVLPMTALKSLAK